MAKDSVALRYVGRNSDGVSVKLADGSWSAPVEHGGTFETTEDHAASLLTQHGEWERVPSRTAPKQKEEVNDG